MTQQPYRLMSLINIVIYLEIAIDRFIIDKCGYCNIILSG